MLVGRRSVDPVKLKQACTSGDTLLQFTINLVPPEVRHVRAIVDNQKYYVATMVRSFKSIPYIRKMKLCDELLRGVIVKGVCNELYDYDDLLADIDKSLLQRLLSREES